MRDIEQMKRFKILENLFEISLLKTSENIQRTGICYIDKMLIVCAALCNFQPSLTSYLQSRDSLVAH